MYKFELGECEIIGPNGQSRVVNTLEHALQQCDTTAAAGISGLGFDLLAHMDPSTVRPLLRVWFGQGRWDYTRRVDAILMHSAGGVPYGRVCARKNEKTKKRNFKETKY